MNNILSKEEIISSLNKTHKSSIIVLDTVNSTNSYAKELSNANAAHETIVISNRQTEGRGRLGRDFFSPEDTGIYMSIIIDPGKILLPSSLLTVAAGVAVCRVINDICDASPSIKWVNDIFVNNKKVCGILAEGLTDCQTNTLYRIILGIGLNVYTPSSIFPGKLPDIAGSIFPKNTSRNEIIAKIVNELTDLYMKSTPDDLIEEYKGLSLILGKKISFTQNGKAYNGIASDINIEGNLVIALENGETIVLKSGEVSLGSQNFAK